MKKIIVFGLALMLCLSSAACTGADDKNEASDSGSSAVSAQTSGGEEQTPQGSDQQSSDASDAVPESSASGKNLVMKNFGELWMGDEFYIDVMMRNEYDPSKLSSSAESAEGSEEGTKTVEYDYIIAVDFENNKAGLNMISDKGSTCYVVKDNRLYDINHSDKTYTKELYDGMAENFGEEFTVKRGLGSINNCTLIDSGTTEYEGKQVKFEKYTMKSQDPAYKDPEVTYYFTMKDKPVAEIIETTMGKTTFIFRTVSNTIPVPEILEIPAGYKEVSAAASQTQ